MDEKKIKEVLSIIGKRGGNSLKAQKLKEDPNYYRNLGLKSAESKRKARKEAVDKLRKANKIKA